MPKGLHLPRKNKIMILFAQIAPLLQYHSLLKTQCQYLNVACYTGIV